MHSPDDSDAGFLRKSLVCVHNRVNEDRGTQGERHPREHIGKDNLKVGGEGIYQDSQFKPE